MSPRKRTRALVGLGAALAVALVVALAQLAGGPDASRTAGGVERAGPEARAAAALAPEDAMTLAAAPPPADREVAAAPEPVLPAPAPASDPEPAVLRVRVVSRATGEPVRDVDLRASASDAMRTERTFVQLFGTDGGPPALDGDGRAELVAPPGLTLHLSIARSDAWHDSRRRVDPLEPGEEREVLLELVPAKEFLFVGRVVRASDGQAVAGAEVRTWPGGRFRTPGAPPAEWSQPPEQVSDFEGLFEVRAVSTHERILIVEAPGAAPAFTTVTQGHDARARARAIALRDSASLEVRLKDSAGQPLAQTWVRLETSGSLRSSTDPRMADIASARLEWTGSTDAEGRSLFERLPPDVPLALEVRSRDWRNLDEAEVTLFPGERRTLTLQAGQGACVHGVLVDQDGRPVADHGVWLLAADELEPCLSPGLAFHFDPPAYTATDARGAFEIAGVRAGTWVLGAAPTDDVAPVGRRFDVPPGAFELRVDLEAVRDLWIEGVVLGPDGGPAGSAGVGARHASSGCTANTPVRPDGSFRVGPLRQGRHEVYAYRVEAGTSEPVLAKPGDHVELCLRPAGSLRVTAREAGDGEERLCELLVTPGGDVDGRRMRTASRLEHVLEGLAPGPHDVVATTADGLVGTAWGVPVRAGAEWPRVELTLHPSGTLRVRRPQGGGAARLRVLQSEHVVADLSWQPDRDALVLAPPGALVVRVQLAPGAAELERTAHVAAGAETLVDLRE